MTDLADRMRAINHPRSEELRAAADRLDTAVAALDPRQTLSAWAKARRLWRECTGEDLV